MTRISSRSFCKAHGPQLRDGLHLVGEVPRPHVGDAEFSIRIVREEAGEELGCGGANAKALHLPKRKSTTQDNGLGFRIATHEMKWNVVNFEIARPHFSDVECPIDGFVEAIVRVVDRIWLPRDRGAANENPTEVAPKYDVPESTAIDERHAVEAQSVEGAVVEDGAEGVTALEPAVHRTYSTKDRPAERAFSNRRARSKHTAVELAVVEFAATAKIAVLKGRPGMPLWLLRQCPLFRSPLHA